MLLIKIPSTFTSGRDNDMYQIDLNGQFNDKCSINNKIMLIIWD